MIFAEIPWALSILRYSSHSQNIDFRVSRSRLSIWNEYPRISNFVLFSLSMDAECSQCSLSIQNLVAGLARNPEILISTFCLLSHSVSRMSVSISEILSIAIVTSYSIQLLRNRSFFGPFAVICSQVYPTDIAFSSSPYEDTSTRQFISFPVSRIAREALTFITVWIWDLNRYHESTFWKSLIFLSKFSGMTIPIHSTSHCRRVSMSSGMISWVIFMGIGKFHLFG